MAAGKRTKGRKWVTDQLFTRTKTTVYAVQWYELSTGDVSEVEVTVRGKKFVRTIANVNLEESQPRNGLEKLIEGLVREIDGTC